MKKIVCWLVIVAMVGMSLSGCAPQQATPAQTAAPAVTAAQAATAAPQETAKVPEKKVKLAWYVPASHPFFEATKVGVDAFAKESGMEVVQQIGPDWNQDSENTGVLALSAKGCNYFSIYPSDASAANGLYKEVVANGGTVVNFGGSTFEPTPASLVFMTSMKKSAADALEYVVKKMGGKGNVMVVVEILEDPNTKLRLEGIDEMLAKYPDVKQIQVAGMASEKEAIEKMESSLSANEGKVDGIVTVGFTAAQALARILTDYQTKTGKHIPAIGIDDSDIILEAIRKGFLDATYAQNPYGMGYLSMYSLKLMSEGYKPAQGIYNIDAGSVIVTKDNVDTYKNDLIKVTEQIKADLPTKYLTK